nr:phosphatidylinositol 4-phosphate 5-kinase 8-like isoform X1 [Tanacetum cinerariifolium]
MREVRHKDFGERARISMYFPKKGSQLTPSHYSMDFYWKDHCPMVFRNLREMFKLDAADYMMSICGDDGLRELSSPGKSGSLFYLSHDDRFVIKTLRTTELKMLRGRIYKKSPSNSQNSSDTRMSLITHVDRSIPPKGLLLVTHEPTSVNTAPGPHSRGSTMRAFSVGDNEVDLVLPGTARAALYSIPFVYKNTGMHSKSWAHNLELNVMAHSQGLQLHYKIAENSGPFLV